MEAFQRLDAIAVPMPVPNVDTDQIIPARFLRKPRKDGYGQYLFHDLRFDDGGGEKPEFVLNRPPYRVSADRAAGRGDDDAMPRARGGAGCAHDRRSRGARGDRRGRQATSL